MAWFLDTGLSGDHQAAFALDQHKPGTITER
jgi:hypothetical protein